MPNTSNSDIQRNQASTAGADLDTDVARIFYNPAHYTAGIGPVNLSTPNVHIYDRSGFTMRDLDEMATRIQARARPAERSMSTYYNAIVRSGENINAYTTQEIVQRYGHLLTAADQQRLGYVAPPPTPVDGQEFHTLSYPGTRLRGTSLATSGDIADVIAYAFGDHPYGNSVKDAPQPVANFLAPPPGPTDQELAAADEWLRNSPWG